MQTLQVTAHHLEKLLSSYQMCTAAIIPNGKRIPKRIRTWDNVIPLHDLQCQSD